MALFSKKTEDTVDAPKAQSNAVEVSKGRNVLIIPRVSEKSVRLNKENKYVFKITGKMNKVEVKKAIEKLYSVSVVAVNMVNVKSRSRTFGRTRGKTSPFKKAIITLKEGQSIEAAKES